MKTNVMLTPLIEAETYLLTCMRYIELNPVRANMANDPGAYPWSSYRHNGLGQIETRIAEHPLYRSLGLDDESRRNVYRALFRSQLDDEVIDDIRLAIAQGQPLGSERFRQQTCAATGVRRIQARRGRPTKRQDINAQARDDQTDFGF